MPYYRSVGSLPRKRHVQFRQDSGELHVEELMSSEGFSEESALLYHRHSPMAITSAELLATAPDALRDNAPVLPRHLRLHECPEGGDAISGRRLLLANEDVRISYAVAGETSPLYRDAVGDELVYLESGRATFESVFGRLEVGEGDYVVVPTHTTHRWVVHEPVRMLCIDSRSHVRVPARYLSTRGQLLEGAPYSERDVRGPDGPLLADGADVPVLVRTGAGLTRYTYAHHPFDVVGWDGCLYPWVFSIHDFEPIVGSVHQPPPVHQTFAGSGFVVCSFVPRLFDFGPGAVPVPYAHANVDSDEVLFYVGGDFMSRAGSGIGPGSMSLHPAGFVHGPQPGSVERALGRPATDELAVMIDTFRPLRLTDAALEIEDTTYAWTWSGS
ncbi:MAG TPA: cupin domain-containing protein [Acidimicrobiales bacterium]|nr:cupin domain-containing protein [Acidimicrobiales bacterium]